MTTITDIPPELGVEYDRVAYQGKGEQIYQCAAGPGNGYFRHRGRAFTMTRGIWLPSISPAPRGRPPTAARSSDG